MGLRSEVYIKPGDNLGESLIGCRICGESMIAAHATEEVKFLKEHRGHLAPIERIMEKHGIQCSDIDENELHSKRAF